MSPPRILGFETDPCRIDRLPEVLDRLDAGNEKATFFVLGCVAAVHPGLVRLIAGRGHEVAASMWNEDSAYGAERAWFQSEVRRVRECLEDATGEPVIGFRAPDFSINRRNLWALGALAAAGFLYDSSIYAGLRWPPGILGWPRGPRSVGTPRGTIIEIPACTFTARPPRSGVPACSVRTAFAARLESLASNAPDIELADRAGDGIRLRLWRWVFDPAEWS